MKHEEQLREVKRNNTILEKKLERERCLSLKLCLSLHQFLSAAGEANAVSL